MAARQTGIPRLQHQHPVTRRGPDEADDIRHSASPPSTVVAAGWRHLQDENEMQDLSGVAGQPHLFLSSAYRSSPDRSIADRHGEAYARFPTPGPSSRGAANFLRKISQRVTKTPRSPTTPKALHFMTINPKNDRYESLQDRDTEDEQDPVGIDLSTLSGLGLQLMPAPNLSVPQDLSPHSGPGKRHTDNDQPVRSQSQARSLGDGMVVGAQLRPTPSAAALRAKSQRHKSASLGLNDEVQRAKSIRDLAQGLARRTQQVVVVDEPPLPGLGVDLSLLEGIGQRQKTNRSFEDMDAIAQAKNTRSYFYPEDRNPPNWKPWTMTSYYILFLIILSLALAVAQEYLLRLSMRLENGKDGILRFNRMTEVPLWTFFCWKYLPTLTFVIYGVLWQIMDFEIKRLEPYYRLSQPCGSTAAESINLDHLSLWSYLVPFKAFRLRQWAVFFSAIGNLLTTSVCPSLQNPTIRFDENPDCDLDGCPDGQYKFYVRIIAGWSRALTSFITITAVLATILLVQMRRKSGLLSDPKGIAGIAAMATKSHILNDFQGMDLATHRQIHSRLRYRRYLLYKASIWQGEYDTSHGSEHEGGQKLESPHPMMLRLRAGIVFISCLAFCLLAIPVINFTKARIIPNTLPWLPILVATLIKVVWTTFEFDVRMMEPFYILSKGNARPEMSLTLDYQGTVYGWFPLKALLNGHYIVALVGFSSILADVLTVTVSSFSVNGAGFLHSNTGSAVPSEEEDETFKSFWGSVILSMVILAFLILSAALVYVLRRHPFLPRQPSTIAAVLAFIHASQMLHHDFIDTETLSNADMERRLKATGKRYGLGWFKGRDGRWHCAIDQEPMRSRYVHGVSYTMAQEPWHDHGSGSLGGYEADFTSAPAGHSV